ncbi:MAG: 6-phosphogluconolactonase [Chlamydiae bacterium]|nr:6-phosphogluconolactonase [Chlamydiota bacterium]
MLTQPIKPFIFDEKTEIFVPGDKEATIYFSVAQFLSIAKKAIDTKGSFFVALFGGSTPKPIYELLCARDDSRKVDWSKVHIFWSDERNKAPTDSESNYHMAMHHGIQKLPIPEENIHRMHAEEKIEQNAFEYEKTIKRVLKDQPFDLVMLGIGDDGHTASLFPKTEALRMNDRLVAANFVSQKNTWRMTMTYPCINAAKNIVIYVLGPDKKEILHKVFAEPAPAEKFPCQLVGTAKNKACWITDIAAAELIYPLLLTKPKGSDFL